MSDDLVWLAAIVLAAKAWNEWMESSPAKAIERGGAKIYEFVHPEQRAHANDLPGHQWTKARVWELAKATGFPDPTTATAIAFAESGGVPQARTRTDREDSIGLWQINVRAHPKYAIDELMIPEYNAVAAFEISKGGVDWRPWSVVKTGRYRQFLPPSHPLYMARIP